MRYVQGTDLRSLIVGGHGLEPERIAELIRPIAGALDAAHRRGLVHRDVKPANILIALDERVLHRGVRCRSVEQLRLRLTPAINQGSAANRIAAECVDGPQGVTLRMFINDIAVNTVVDPDNPFVSGAVGFRVESENVVTEAVFDDLVVRATG